jgi:hypothetical protein
MAEQLISGIQTRTGTAADVADQTIRSGEDPAFDRTFGGAKCIASAIKTADALISSGASILYGYVVHAATATAAITIEDGITAGAGETKITIPATKAAGEYALPVGILCPTGIYLNYAASATGSISLLYLPAAA